MLKRVMSSKPLRMWIDGKPYDIKALTKKQKKLKKDLTEAAKAATAPIKSQQSEDAPSKEEVVMGETVTVKDDNKTPETSQSECEICCNNNDESGHDFAILFKDGKFSTGFRLPSYYYIKLRQQSASLMKEITENTKTRIDFPTSGKEGDVTITGDSEASICEARNEMHSVIGEIRGGLSALQFIAMPILSDEVRDNFEKFKAEVLALEGTTGVEESIFQKSTKLHLTIVVFALMDEKEKAAAAKALEEYKEKILSDILNDKGPITLKISGVDCMNDDHTKVHVLYAKAQLIEETDDHNLQKIANGLSDYFYDQGFVLRHQDNVKLHMTLMNTKYRSHGESPRRWVKRQSFNATKIMEKYKDYDFGTCQLDSIRISLISSKDEDGFYKTLSSIMIA